MEVETAMEVDEAASAPSPSSKRLAVKNTIQTNFGDDYVFQIAAKYLISPFPLTLFHCFLFWWRPAWRSR